MRPEMTEACKGKPNDYTDEESAFPVGNEGGLTKREWFAGMALMGLMAHHGSTNPSSLPMFAYLYADAMIKRSDRSQND